jgi:hypothetical protein
MEPNLRVNAKETVQENVSTKLGGGARSMRIQAVLRDHLFAGVGDRRASRTLSDIQWVRAQNESIQLDDFREVWHAGQVSAIVSNGHDVVVGTGTGGVWLLKPGANRQFATGTPLSDGSDVPDVSSLAWGPDRPRFVFVGCTGGSAMFLLEFDLVTGGMEFKRSITLPMPLWAACTAIVTFDSPRLVVVATDQGVWWSAIPKIISDAAGYVWRMGLGLPFANYSGMTQGSDTSVVVAINADVAFKGSPPPPAGIYRGTFQGDTLAFTQSKITGADPSLMRRTSVASCSTDTRRVYSVSASDGDTILCVLSSQDGGANWTASAKPDPSAAGLQGFYNNCIAVSPRNPDTVVIGWLSGGAFWSTDAAQSWLHPNTQESNPNLHNDLHALCFASNPNDDSETVYVGGDGGIVFTRDLGKSYDSQLNHRLNNLQFYGAGNGKTAGTLTASSRYPGLLAGGTQDNGNIFLTPGADPRKSSFVPEVGPGWHTLDGGDGDINRFVDPLGALLRFNNTLQDPTTKIEFGNKVRIAFWNPAVGSFGPGTGTVILAADTPSGSDPGINPSALETVNQPTFQRNGQLLYAATASTDAGVIHGMFANSTGGNAKFLRLGSIGVTVSALASLTGERLLVGTSTGRILSFDCSSGGTAEFELPPQVFGEVSRIEIIAPLLAYALVGVNILRLDGTTWTTTNALETTSDPNWKTFTVDPDSRRLYAATDSDVWVSHDSGRSWVDSSTGLPKRPHCTDLRVAPDIEGGTTIYLATYGRSVWRATITRPPDAPPSVPKAVNDVIVGVINDGWGLVRRGGKIVPVPPPSPLLVFGAQLIGRALGAVRRGLRVMGGI